MVFRVLRGVGALGTSARELRQKFIKQATIFGDPTESLMKLKSDTVVQEEPELDAEDKRYKILMDAHSKSADKLIDRFGMKSVLKLAKWNSILDIFTSAVAICAELAVATAIVAGVGLAVFKNNTQELIDKVKEEGDSAQLALEVGVAGVGAFVIFAWLRRFLDDMQRILVDRVKIKLKKDDPAKFSEFMKLEDKYVEEEIKGPSDNLLYAHLQDVPIIGKLFGHLLDEYYNIKLEMREIRALKEMEKFISNVEKPR
jgi:hypothetical protein